MHLPGAALPASTPGGVSQRPLHASATGHSAPPGLLGSHLPLGASGDLLQNEL
jgi:hypothetical protein